MQINKCPKCGREPSNIELIIPLKTLNILGYEIECYDCGLHSGRCDTEEEAINKWNELTKGDNNGND
jgi:hypothetical protein